MNPQDEPRAQVGDLSPDGRQYWDGDIWQWQPLWLTEDEVLSGAERCFAQPATSAHFLAAGLLNQSWHVETDQGAYVLRVGREERSREQIAYEHAFTHALSKRVGAVVAPLPGREGETIQHWQGRILSLFPFIEGVLGTAVDPEVRAPQAPMALAQLHRASLDHLGFSQRPGFRSVDEHPRWIWSTVRPILKRDLAGTDGVDDFFGTLDREVAGLDTWLDRLHASQRLLPRATVHGDFNPRNLIFRDNRLVAVIDWDECRVEPLAWEVAQVGFGSPDITPRAFWRTYLEAGGPLAPEDFDLLPGFARMSALAELQWSVKDGRATPHARKQLREVVTALSWLRQREAETADL